MLTIIPVSESVITIINGLSISTFSEDLNLIFRTISLLFYKKPRRILVNLPFWPGCLTLLIRTSRVFLNQRRHQRWRRLSRHFTSLGAHRCTFHWSVSINYILVTSDDSFPIDS